VTIGRRGLLVIVGLYLWGLMTHSTSVGTGDEPHYLAIAHSLAFDRDLDLTNNYRNGEWITGGVEPGAHVARGRDGTLRPVHDVGLPVLFAPYVAVMRPAVGRGLTWVPARWLELARLQPETLYRHVLSSGMIVVALLLANQLLTTLLALGIKRQIASAVVVLVALSPPLAIHSITFFTDLLSALMCAFVFQRIVVADDDRVPPWAWAGATTGLLMLVHSRNAGLIAGFVLLAAWTWRRRNNHRQALAFAIAFIAAIVLRTMVTFYLWGTWLTSPHARGGTWDGLTTVAFHRLGGMLFDQEYGLLLYAPMFVLTAFAVRTHRQIMRPIVLLVVAYLVPILLPITNVHGWTAGWSPAARFWVPIVPLLALLLAAAIERAPLAVVISIVGLQTVLSAYFWQNPKDLWNDGDGIAAVCERSGFTVCNRLPSFVQASDAVASP
jgi:hypothetical protein